MMIDLERLERVHTLSKGAHSPDGEMCVMEAAAYVAGEPWSDAPICVSPVITSFLRSWNDALPDDATRTRLLRPLIPDVIGTQSDHDGMNTRLAWLLIDWFVRTHTVAWLRLTPSLVSHATALEGLPEVTVDTWVSIGPQLAAARAAAGDAAWDAAWAAAWDAAWDAAGDAARDAARDALTPTKEGLQASALRLLDRMIDPEVQS